MPVIAIALFIVTFAPWIAGACAAIAMIVHQIRNPDDAGMFDRPVQ